MKTALQELIEWAETPAMAHTENKSIMTKMKELLEKEKQIIITAYKTGYLESGHLDYYPDKHSKEYYDELLRGEAEQT
jgi:predicted DNA-binding protein with PD1-like motif